MTINEPTGKTCADCTEWKLFTEFYKKKGRKDPYHSYCKGCLKIRNKTNYQKNNVQRRTWQRDHNAKIKQQVYDAYGNVCACCGEDNPFFLSIDHVNNDGADHRRSLGADPTSGVIRGVGMQLYYEIIREDFSERFQILCYNCNCGKARNGGICPHFG